MRVLLVDDDSEFSQELSQGLNNHGLETVRTDQGRRAIEYCEDVDIILLDLALPDIDGFQVCQEIRANSSVPIIILSGRSDEFDQVLSLKIGADDYVVKPCRLRELSARIEAVVRRARGAWSTRAAQQVRRLRELRIDYSLRQAVVDGSEIPLTPKEFDLLYLLTSEPGRIFTREQIMSEVWGYDTAGDTRTLGVHMVSLRRKLGTSVRIETVRGLGFRLVA
jgi:two-component system, OmpR family, response regulator RegX3